MNQTTKFTACAALCFLLSCLLIWGRAAVALTQATLYTTIYSMDAMVAINETLLEQAFHVSGMATADETVNAAIKEFIKKVNGRYTIVI